MAEAESLETAAEHERILREIESTDTACIGPTLRSVYDGEEHGRFMEKLETRIRNHDREIEKMCNFHYQGFVDSITELLKVRGEAQKLKVRRLYQILYSLCSSSSDQRIVVRSQPLQIVCETLSQKYSTHKGLVEWLKWQGACLASVKPRVQTTELEKKII
uniref:Exocyst complex component EXOC6/Sec15 N-terminal domain-containing protein n=1 Tax=Castor canadensis TaxID=51338 RepID=A0A8C0XGC4_CASCN